MNYFIDTEFLEGTQREWYGNSIPTIDIISIALVAEDGREYYAISKDFNLKEAWKRYDLKPDIDNGGMKKVYWIRENVLRPVFHDLRLKNNMEVNEMDNLHVCHSQRWLSGDEFSYSMLKKLLKKYGQSNKQIAHEIIDFTYQQEDYPPSKPIFYGYYADYDWVVFCWLFGKMNDLPKGLPMYCRDLQQIADEIPVGKLVGLPPQSNEHNALADARWNKQLYHFLQSL